ncbi:MAG TPA: histidinol dehydrogenase [Solirubrobacterales bacterium]|nr:histidinol dehydrogenase [Solirubrobacterales bacterium]
MRRLERVDWDGSSASELAARLRSSVPGLAEASGEVSALIERVRAGGDAALREIAAELGEAAPDPLRVDPEAPRAALAGLGSAVRDALEVAARNIEAVARADAEVVAAPSVCELPEGQRVEVRRQPVGAAGVYAPGGRAAYPSSVLMCAIPARVAGVGRVAVATPPGEGGAPPATVLAACAVAGVDEVYAIGGAQAVAALACGTESVPAVDVIAGPGSRWVTEAKRLVAGEVGIDGIAGPSELVIVAGPEARANWVALDVLAQAEHGDESPLAVLSWDRGLLDRVAGELDRLAADRPTVSAAPVALVAAPDADSALRLADAFAPEHLELAYDGAGEEAARERVAGCVFVGHGAATAFGDYAAGSNHVLPTGGAARFGGPLGPAAFLRRTSVVSLPEVAAEALAPHVAALAEAEGMPVHGESATARAKEASDERGARTRER